MRASQTLRATFSYCSPIETFTFLTTDIEGSTKLLTRLGVEDYASALSDHHAIIREALRAHGGREKGTQGDSFLATFTSPSACVAAAVDAQRALGAHEWPCGQQLKVRMGIPHRARRPMPRQDSSAMRSTVRPASAKSATAARSCCPR